MHYLGGTNLTGHALVAATKRCMAKLETHKITPSCVVMQGVSGMAVGMVLAAKLGCNYAVVRKPNEDSHSYEKITGDIPGTGQIVIVDDFTACGDTIIRVLRALKGSKGWNEHRDVNVLLYQQQSGPSMTMQTNGHHFTDAQVADHGMSCCDRDLRLERKGLLERVTFLCCDDDNALYNDEQ